MYNIYIYVSVCIHTLEVQDCFEEKSRGFFDFKRGREACTFVNLEYEGRATFTVGTDCFCFEK